MDSPNAMRRAQWRAVAAVVGARSRLRPLVYGAAGASAAVDAGRCVFFFYNSHGVMALTAVGGPPAIRALWPVRVWSITGVPPQRARLLVATIVSGIWYLVSVAFYSSGIEWVVESVVELTGMPVLMAARWWIPPLSRGTGSCCVAWYWLKECFCVHSPDIGRWKGGACCVLL